jgi:hypothetical protein
MTTATTERDAIVSQPAREKVFTARREDLTLVLVPEYPILNAATGQKTGQVSRGLRISFRGGLLRLPLEGTVRTENGHTVDVAEVWPYIEQHPLNGDRYEGFVEFAQTAPPVTPEEIDALTNAAISLNSEALQEIIDAESAGWGREALLAPAQKALASIEALKTADDAAPAKPKAQK